MPAHGPPDRQERHNQHRDADSSKAEAERRPDEQRNRRIQERRRSVGTRGGSVEDEDSQRHRTRTDESWPDFAAIDVHFTYTGIDGDQAASYTQIWMENCPLYRAVAKATKVTVTHEVK